MATFGLKIAGGVGKPGLLSEVFKGAFGDPELKAKLALMSSQIWGQEHQNRLYDASTEEKRQLAAKAEQELADLKARAAAMDAAGGPVGENLASHEPVPVAIDPAPDEVKRLTGPTMPFIQPADQKRYDTATAADRALGRLYVRDPNVDQVQQAIQHQAGANILVAGASNPAIVTPDQLRLGATLTGQMPTTTTVLTGGDTAGVDMATRGNIQTEAGKAAIDANKPAIVDIPGRGKVSLTPTGGGSGQIIPGTQPGLTKENAPQFLAALNAKAAANGGKLTDPADIALRDAAQQILTADTIIKRGKDESLLVPGGAGQPLTQVAGPDPNVKTPAYPGDSVSATDSNILLEVALDMAAGRPIDPAKAQQYILAFDRLWPEHAQVISNADGTKQTLDPTPAPAGWPTKEAVAAAASLGAQGGSVVPGGAATPVPAEIARLGQPPAGMVAAPTLAEKTTGVLSPLVKTVPPLTVEQGRDQAFASLMQQPALDMNDIGLPDLPSLAQASQIITDAATTKDPSLISAAIDLASRNAILDPASRAYEQAVAAWTSNSLYKLSGAAITYPEWVRQQLAMVPMFGDEAGQLLSKARARSNFLRVTAKQGWFNDPTAYKSFVEQTRLQGLELDYPIGAMPPIHGPAAGEPRRARDPVTGALIAPGAKPAAAVAPTTPEATPAEAGLSPEDAAADAADKARAPPLTRPEGMDQLSDERWAVIYRGMAWKDRKAYRQHVGEE